MSFVPSEIITDEFLRKYFLYRDAFPQVLFVCWIGFHCEFFGLWGFFFSENHFVKNVQVNGQCMPALFMSFYLQYRITVTTCYTLIPWITEPAIIFILREKCKLCITSYKHGFSFSGSSFSCPPPRYG